MGDIPHRQIGALAHLDQPVRQAAHDRVDARGALAVRFVLLGAGNGWVAVIGPISQDIGGQARQSEVLTLVFATGPFVQMVGPALSGVLSTRGHGAVRARRARRAA